MAKPRQFPESHLLLRPEKPWLLHPQEPSVGSYSPERLLIAACLAYTRMISQGLWVLAIQKSGLIDRTDRVDKSIFRLGWLKYALKRNIDFDPIFSFQPFDAVGNVR